jgi:hypothetical protein
MCVTSGAARAASDEGKPVEGGTGRRRCVEDDRQVGRLVHLARFGVELEGELDVVSFDDARCGAVGCTDADEVPPALREMRLRHV